MPGSSQPLALSSLHEQYKPLVARMTLGGLGWDDILLVLRQLESESLLEVQDTWHTRLSVLGGGYEERAVKASATRELAVQRRMLLKAAACHHFAALPYFDNPEAKFMSRRRAGYLFQAASGLLPHEIRSLRIPCGDFTLPAYLLRANANGRAPCVLLVNDLSSAKELELYTVAQAFLAQDLSVILFDGPGQGVLAGLHAMPAHFEDSVGSVLAEVAERSEVDRNRLGICGLGHGGFLAVRAAALDRRRLKACISISGRCEHDHFTRLPELTREEFKYAYCQRDELAMARLARDELNLRRVTPLAAPLLVVQDLQDPSASLASCDQLFNWARGDREIFSTSLEPLGLERMGRWMAEALSRQED